MSERIIGQDAGILPANQTIAPGQPVVIPVPDNLPPLVSFDEGIPPELEAELLQEAGLESAIAPLPPQYAGTKANPGDPQSPQTVAEVQAAPASARSQEAAGRPVERLKVNLGGQVVDVPLEPRQKQTEYAAILHAQDAQMRREAGLEPRPDAPAPVAPFDPKWAQAKQQIAPTYPNPYPTYPMNQNPNQPPAPGSFVDPQTGQVLPQPNMYWSPPQMVPGYPASSVTQPSQMPLQMVPPTPAPAPEQRSVFRDDPDYYADVIEVFGTYFYVKEIGDELFKEVLGLPNKVAELTGIGVDKINKLVSGTLAEGDEFPDVSPETTLMVTKFTEDLFDKVMVAGIVKWTAPRPLSKENISKLSRQVKKEVAGKIMEVSNFDDSDRAHFRSAG